MKKRFLWLMFSWLIVAALVLASCGPAAPGEQEEEEIEVLGFPRSETLFLNQLTGVVGTPDNFNEWVGWKWRDRGAAQLMNEPLWTIDPTAGVVINGLASGPAEYNEDFTQMTIKLREGVYWSDGVEFTADDVVFTIELLSTTPGMNYNAQLQGVESVRAEGKYTVVVELTEPNSRFHTYFLDRWGCCWIMPKHVFEQVEDPLTFEYNPPLSLGPYVLHSYDPAGFWTAWEKRDDWDRTPTGMLYGEPAPKYVVFEDVGEPALQVMAMTRHELDIGILDVPAQTAALLVDPYAFAYLADFPWIGALDPCVTGLAFNTLKPPFDNSEVRWALALAIDIVSYTATAFDGAVVLSALLTPAVPLYMREYYEPMEEWLAGFTLDLGNGETFQPYDPDAPYRLAEYAEARGYTVPEDIKGTLGYGWWKYAPDVAARLLEKNGFSRDKDGNWLLPDGTPWKFTVLTGTQAGGASYQNAFAAAHEWRKFGIDIEVMTSEITNSLQQHGEFDVCTAWPVYEAWGAHLDMYRSFDNWNSAYVEPVLGEPHYGHTSRWSDPRMDQIIADLKGTDWNDDDRMAELGIAGLKIAIEEMPGIPTYAYPSAIANDTYYWTNWPSADNLYTQPHHHWPNFKYMLPFLEPTGR